MPKQRNLQLEANIFRLKSMGLTARGIARELKISASSVSRVLQREPARVFLNELNGRVDALEQQMAVCLDVMLIVAKFAGHHGAVYRQQTLAVLERLPGDYMKKCRIEGRL